MRVLLGLRPPPPAFVLRRLRGAAAAAASFASGSRAAAVPCIAAPRGGGGFPAWVRSACPAAVLGAGYAPSNLGLLACAPCSPAWSWAQAALRLCAGYAPSNLGLSLSRSCALLGLGRKPPRASVLRPNPARCRVQPLSRSHAAPAAKLHQNPSKLHQKASKSALFVRHIAASVTESVNRQYAKKPRLGGFLGSC